MRFPVLLTAACLFSVPLLHSQPAPVLGPQAPEPPPTYELDKNGKRAHIVFSLKVKPISEPNLRFSKFAGHKTLIFYFSAKCPHCQIAFPHVQKVADSLISRGYSAVAIVIKYNSDDDIHNFIRDLKVKMPVFQDEERTFGDNYGTGYVPVIFLTNDKGEYIRYKNFNEESTSKWILKEASLPANK